MRQFEGDSIPYTKATGHTPRSSIGDALAQPDSVRRRSSGRRGPACDFHAKDRAPPPKACRSHRGYAPRRADLFSRRC